VLASGYSDDSEARQEYGALSPVFVQKPYVAGELIAALTTAIGSESATA
jgi:hypothetical protein